MAASRPLEEDDFIECITLQVFEVSGCCICVTLTGGFGEDISYTVHKNKTISLTHRVKKLHLKYICNFFSLVSLTFSSHLPRFFHTDTPARTYLTLKICMHLHVLAYSAKCHEVIRFSRDLVRVVFVVPQALTTGFTQSSKVWGDDDVELHVLRYRSTY